MLEKTINECIEIKISIDTDKVTYQKILVYDPEKHKSVDEALNEAVLNYKGIFENFK